MAKQDQKIKSVTDYYGVIEPFGQFFLTKHGSLIGAIELTGWDPDGLVRDDHAGLSAIAASIYSKLHRSISVSQYYAHFEGVTAELRDRAEIRSHTLSKRREGHLNGQKLSGARIVHYLEIEPDEDLNKLKLPQLLKHIGMAPFDTRSRDIVANSIGSNKSFLVQLDELRNMAAQLADALQEVVSKWSGLFPARCMSQSETWAHLRFIATLDPRQLTNALTEAIPSQDLDIYVTSGDIVNVQVNRMDVLKMPGVVNTYARVASVRRFIQKGGKIKASLWAADGKSPVRQTGNFLLITRWKPMTEFQRSWMFTAKNASLERAQLNFMDMFKGGEDRSELERQAGMKPRLKKMMEELGAAESISDLWGQGDGYVVAFGEDPKAIKETALKLNQSVGNASVNLIWETVDIDRSFAALQPGQFKESKRTLYMTASQFGAASLIYQASPGQMTVPDLVHNGRAEEAQYYFTSRDGTLFGYSPFVGGRAMVVGVGPIRSGKSFLKNTVASHFFKYTQSLFRSIGIDPGDENLAHLFGGGNGNGIFRVSNEDGRGYNPFVSYRGPKDQAFRAHFTQLALLMLQANDSLADRTLTPEEQDQFDDALEQTLELKRKTLSHFVAHLPEGVRRKFSRWVRSKGADMGAASGRYANLFDVDTDSVGALDTRVGVFNLQALRDDAKALNPVLLETLYRITQAFEDPALREVPKELDVDEAHYLLQIEAAALFLVSKVRTWGKWFGSVHLWTQSPQELENLKHWPAIRSAATTFWFMADPQMDVDLYMRTFNLTRGQCEAIKGLIPKREAFIFQPELGVSKVVVVNVEAEQRVFNTSHPREAAMRDRLIAAHGFAEGMRLAVEALEAKAPQPSEAVTSA